MYLAMSRLKVISGKEVEFEKAWRDRETSIDGVKGFKKLNLIKGYINNEYSLYVFHSEWDSKKDFTNWIKSDSFKIAHIDPTSQKNLFLGPPDFDGYQEQPDFEGFKVVI
jgi:heme-degrading monooxygenase HmoA